MRPLLLVFMSLLPSTAFAQQQPGGLPPPVAARPPLPGQQASSTIVAEPIALMLAGFDADGDARTSRTEAEAGVARSFAGVDTDKTGAIGYIAFADWAERWLGDRNAIPSPFETDTDGDNRITLAELQAKVAINFTRFDRDKDGVLSHAELVTLDSARSGFNQLRDPKRKRR